MGARGGFLFVLFLLTLRAPKGEGNALSGMPCSEWPSTFEDGSYGLVEEQRYPFFPMLVVGLFVTLAQISQLAEGGGVADLRSSPRNNAGICQFPSDTHHNFSLFQALLWQRCPKSASAA